MSHETSWTIFFILRNMD